MMKRIASWSMVAALVVTLGGCVAPPAHQRCDPEKARRLQERRAAEAYEEYLVGYARTYGKRRSELTSADLAAAHRAYRKRFVRTAYY